MGRYYSGDIEGKFWFGVQPSDDAEFFGAQGYSSYLQFHFDDSNLADINKGISKCKRELMGYLRKLDKFFKENNGYNDEMLIKALKVNEDKVRHLLSWYARLILGKKILKCVKEQDYCSFEAELWRK